MKVFTVAGSRAQPVQCIFKSMALLVLKAIRVEQREADVTERKDANDKKEGSAPTEKRTGSCRRNLLTFKI